MKLTWINVEINDSSLNNLIKSRPALCDGNPHCVKL